jgi:hypothetical protein
MDHGIEESRDQLYAMSQRFPVRVDRRTQDDKVLAQRADERSAADENVTRDGLRELAARAHGALDRALTALDTEDRLLIRLCFWERMSVADIARSLAVPQKPLYRRIESLLNRLRTTLEQDGVVDEARALLDHLWSDLLETPGDGTYDASHAGTRAGIAGMRPSMDGEVSSARR